MDINKTVEALKGKKRWILAGLLAITVLLKALGYNVIPNSVYQMIGLEDVKVTPITETVTPAK